MRHAVAAAGRFLIGHQDDDGHWRDYALAPGRSEAWITGCVGWALCSGRHLPRSGRLAVDRAVRCLRASQRPEGWGYSHRTACDADSTSWVIRFLARAGALRNVSASSLLGAYMTPTGAVRTFCSPDRFGSWAAPHDEVAPLAGLALLSARERGLAAAVRTSVLSAWVAGDGWKPFWWPSGGYASAASLRFLSASGGIPRDLAADERARLLRTSAATSAFEAAQQLVSAVHLEAWREARRLADSLLQSQVRDGGWPASAALLVPRQREPSQFEIICDDRRLLSTAMSVMALACWLQRVPSLGEPRS